VTTKDATLYDALVACGRQWAAFLSCAAALLSPAAGCAAVFTVNEPWVRPAAAGGASEAYMELTSSEEATLVDARCAIASRISLVTGQRRKPPPFALALPARTTVTLAPGGVHIALADVERSLKRGERVAFTLVIRNKDGSTRDIEVDAEVRRRSPSADHGVKH
jgi:copper(I)-binding protein